MRLDVLDLHGNMASRALLTVFISSLSLRSSGEGGGEPVSPGTPEGPEPGGERHHLCDWTRWSYGFGGTQLQEKQNNSCGGFLNYLMSGSHSHCKPVPILEIPSPYFQEAQGPIRMSSLYCSMT